MTRLDTTDPLRDDGLDAAGLDTRVGASGPALGSCRPVVEDSVVWDG